MARPVIVQRASTHLLVGAFVAWSLLFGGQRASAQADCYPPTPGCGTSTSSTSTTTACPPGSAGDGCRSLEVDDTAVLPGQDVTLRAGPGTFGPGSSGIVTIQSVERQLGTFVASSDGSARATVKIPVDIEPGPHTLFMKGVDASGNPVVLSRSITVEATTGEVRRSRGLLGTYGPLALTGLGLTVPAILLGLGLLAFGLVLKHRGTRLGRGTAGR